MLIAPPPLSLGVAEAHLAGLAGVGQVPRSRRALLARPECNAARLQTDPGPVPTDPDIEFSRPARLI